MAGLTSTGFLPKTFEEIREEINADMRAVFGPSVDLSDGSVLGQLYDRYGWWACVTGVAAALALAAALAAKLKIKN